MLVNAKGLPEPPTDILKVFAEVDPRIQMRPYPRGGGHMEWAIIERWSEHDPRRAMIQRGEVPPDGDFDLLGAAPLDMRVEDAMGYLLRALKRFPSDKKELEYYHRRIQARNKAVTDAQDQRLADVAEELLKTNITTALPHLGFVKPVYQNTNTRESSSNRRRTKRAITAGA